MLKITDHFYIYLVFSAIMHFFENTPKAYAARLRIIKLKNTFSMKIGTFLLITTIHFYYFMYVV